MSALRERLMRLGAAGRTGGGDLSARPEERGRGTAVVDKAGIAGTVPVQDAAGREDGWRALGAATARNDWGAFLLRRRAYPSGHRHGRHRLGDLEWALPLLAPVTERQNRRAPVPSARPPGAEAVLFLDLETTGLGVGTGNFPFLIGLAYMESGTFRVEQLFIRHPGEEPAALAHLLDRLRDRTHLATFNGRAFDWPLLTSRFVLNGWRPTGDGPLHLDLLPPSRALWRHALASCRLSAIEEHRLGIEREDDIPGALAPTFYFRYLEDGDPAHVAGVLAHNERDLLALASLAVHLGRLAGGMADPGETAEWTAAELMGAAAWLDAHGRPEQADPLYRELGGRDEPGMFRWLMAAAERWRRLGRFDEAVPLWEKAAAIAERSAVPVPDAHIRLAVYHEHRRKDPAAALVYAERALALSAALPPSRGFSRAPREREEIRRRVERLRRKLAANRD
ncbi:MAG: hypothetical protein BAA02_11105 [Paenibacillaceae bacterium ZCTH02-B3]|nr:MAG: hypothetical protein BAA02_11105 [Paenibacillaceae bacterium ZCTH02-B3]